ncbi:hypothetical protein OG884_00495 [Streptosporangium sp. NBC_01755]|uniref:hypothetical protein n=1 Tax=unclassified Streptosporangium TaxID=2632669 RepID=UPI002DD88374|nr:MULTISPECIES: hypothetical protein [unclassified Streptosporangium]WSA28068.1 hypothetical protein OIE13_09470 [Streptosporangium sp. NBC_01810]WSD00459.1 hypothetical protein OG884_00495 [Streptosporangium sp. NBC_01755]
MSRRSRWAALLAGPAAALMVAGCTTDGGALRPDTELTRMSSPSAAPGPGLFAVNSQRLSGLIVIDVQGYVLYRSDADDASPSRSACVDECAEIWRPMPVSDIGRLRIVGIDRGKIGRVIRPDRTEQLTLSGWPLYGYSGDRMPGDTSGHGRNGWFAISPAGARAGRSTP